MLGYMSIDLAMRKRVLVLVVRLSVFNGCLNCISSIFYINLPR